MYTVYKQEQVFELSRKIGIAQTDVKKVLDCYISRIRNKLLQGETIKFLNICYLSYDNGNTYKETISYISTEIGLELGISRELIYRVLVEFEEIILDDLKRFYTYTIYGLVKISIEEYKKGIFKLRLRKSSSLANMDIRVIAVSSFKRKVENEWKEKRIE